MKVLYIDGVGTWGGASRSLYEALCNMPENEVEKYFVMVKGSVEPYYSRLAKEYILTKGLTRFDNTEYSFYKGIRWGVFLRELFYFPFTLKALYQAKKKWGKDIDLIHVNELTEVIPLLIAKLLFKVPVVCHVRSVTRNDSSSIRCKLLHKVIRTKIDALISIDETVRSSLPRTINTYVIHNSFTAKYADTRDVVFEKKISQIKKAKLTVGFVGNLLKSKGILEMLEAAKITKQLGLDINYIIIGGETRSLGTVKKYFLNLFGFNQDFYQEAKDFIKLNDLQDMFHLIGSTFDIQRGYEYFDVNCFASHFNAPGRPVFEAAFSSVPSIVAVDTPKMDTITHMETGIVIPSKSPQKLANAIEYFFNNRSEIIRMGTNAKKMALENFSPKENADKILKVYKERLSYDK